MLVDHARPLAEEIDALGQAAPQAFSIHIPGKPLGKQRAGRNRFTGHSYTPDQTANAEAWARGCMHEQYHGPLLAGAVGVLVEAVMPVPRSWAKRKQAAALAGTIRPTGKPDWDNIGKLYCDAAKGLLWHDDAQVVLATVSKRYGAAPHVLLRVQSLAGEATP
jgi:Holliday junction resolvase RusA-like endonuclease